MLGIWEETGRSEGFGMKYLVMFLLICLGVFLKDEFTSPEAIYCLGFAVGAVTIAVYFLS